jgi:hypothetical protein
VRDNLLPLPAPTSAIPSIKTRGADYKDETSESEMQLQQELTQTPDLHTEPLHTQRQRSDGISTANIISGSVSQIARLDPDMQHISLWKKMNP